MLLFNFYVSLSERGWGNGHFVWDVGAISWADISTHCILQEIIAGPSWKMWGREKQRRRVRRDGTSLGVTHIIWNTPLSDPLCDPRMFLSTATVVSFVSTGWHHVTGSLWAKAYKAQGEMSFSYCPEDWQEKKTRQLPPLSGKATRQKAPPRIWQGWLSDRGSLI